MLTHRQLALALSAAALVCAGRASATTTFAGGSLIIPMTGNMQDDCGQASAYGLMYNVLRANDWLGNNGYSRITVHWAYKAAKASPNRCVPTEANVPPIYGSYTAAKPPPWNDPNWNDGCDFRVVDTTSVPVKLVNNSKGTDPTQDTNVVLFDTTKVNTYYPGYASVTIKNPTVTSVGYGGGPFIIAASDAQTFLKLLAGTIVATDSLGGVVDFSPFRTQTNSLPPSTFCAIGKGSHYVYVHRSQTSFTADDNTKFNAPPPRVALLDSGSGVASGVLDAYMTAAGLTFTGSVGCPPGGYNLTKNSANCPVKGPGLIYDHFDVTDLSNGLLFSTDANGKNLYQGVWTPHWDETTTVITPPTVTLTSASKTPGLTLGNYAYRVSALNTNGETLPGPEATIAVNAVLPLKQITLTWTKIGGASSYNVYGRTAGSEQLIINTTANTYVDTGAVVPNGAMPTGDTSALAPAFAQALTQISTFLNGSNTGMFAACASIATLEGDSNSGDIAQQNTGTQFMTCMQSSSNPGACANNTLQYGVTKDTNGSPSGQIQNCTDPTAVAAKPCSYFPNAGDPFVQIGDTQWDDQGGSVTNYTPYSGALGTSIYRPTTLSLVYNIASLNKSMLDTPAHALTMRISDETTRNMKDGDPNKANIVYLSGHSYSNSLSGTRVVLGTLLQLGLVYAAQETGYVGATLYNNSVFVPTYDRITSVPTSSAVKKFDPGQGSSFLYPYHGGHLKSHVLSTGLVSGNNAFNDNVQWDAKTAMPTPGNRNVFTYLGGQVTTGSSGLARETGWAPVDFDYTQIQSSPTTCVDKLSINNVATNSLGRNAAYPGMVPGADGVCDLEEALAPNLVLASADLGSDNGASEQAALKTKLLDTSQNGAIQLTQTIAQLVRGFCYATVGGVDGYGAMIANPSNGQCNYHRQDNTVQIGGFVHSQAAIVAASPYVTDAPTGKRRPTVAYLGGLDGQLHAFYVPGPDSNDKGYSGVSGGGGVPFTGAKTVFHNDWLSGGSFNPPAALTELWSFIPPGQIPYLYSNDAQVDSSPVVLDVFGDFDGDGVREWHTVLVASSGGTNRELFALDVSNPLAPVLLWDIQSSYDTTVLPYAPAVMQDDNTGMGGVSLEYAFNWQNKCRASDVSANTCSAASYLLTGTDGGRSLSGWFNYSHLGASTSVQAALLRRNNSPVFAAFVATNEPNGNGMYTFAIDVTTGAKIWELNNPYDKASDVSGMADGLDNTPPAGVTLFSKAGNSLIDTVYVGDLEGSLWELDSADGVNLNSMATQLGGCSQAGSCNFPLSQAFGYDPNSTPQPITTLSTIFVVPSVGKTSALFNYVGQSMLAYGTAGTDKVSSLPYTVTGSVHLFPLGLTGRLSATQVIGPPSKVAQAQSKGLALEVANYPQYATAGERLYGSITAAGDHLFFATTSGTVNNIDSRGQLTGSTYSLNLGAAAGQNLSAIATNAGGAGGTVLVAQNASGTTQVVTVTDQNINVSAPTESVNLKGSSVNGVGQTPTTYLGWFFKALGHE